MHHLLSLENMFMMRMTQTGGTDGSTGRRWTLWGTVLLVAALAGCSLTTGYRYADRVILWKLDHYFDLNRDQRQDLARRLTPLLDRHRHEALPQYEAFLKEIRERVKRGLTGSDIDWAYATYDRLRADLVERMQAQAIEGPWAAGERILACIGPDLDALLWRPR